MVPASLAHLCNSQFGVVYCIGMQYLLRITAYLSGPLLVKVGLGENIVWRSKLHILPRICEPLRQRCSDACHDAWVNCCLHAGTQSRIMIWRITHIGCCNRVRCRGIRSSASTATSTSAPAMAKAVGEDDAASAYDREMTEFFDGMGDTCR